MRAILLIVLALAGCGSDMNVAGSPDLAVCSRGVGAPPNVATPCGPLTCAPGQICVAHQPGAVFPDMAQAVDGGATDAGAPPSYDPYQHSCIVLAAECQSCGGCDAPPGSGGHYFGCFSSICDKYETGCRFDGATLTCIGV
jgi:hypothetical protein